MTFTADMTVVGQGSVTCRSHPPPGQTGFSELLLMSKSLGQVYPNEENIHGHHPASLIQ